MQSWTEHQENLWRAAVYWRKGHQIKSVFMVASKVHIQSGSFSFFFEHQPGARGMGLVTPVWEPAKEALPDPLTRITLTLLDKLDYPELLSQFDALPDTFLLFLKKIGEITIEKIDSGAKISVYYIFMHSR
jgi:hypothetical protein